MRKAGDRGLAHVGAPTWSDVQRGELSTCCGRADGATESTICW